MKSIFTIALSLLFAHCVWSQSTNAPLNEDYYHWIDRYEIKSGTLSNTFHSSWKPYQRAQIVKFIESVDQIDTEADRFNQSYLLNDNWEWADSVNNESKKPLLKHFYRVKSDLYHVNEPDFDLHVNPVLYFGGGKETASDVSTFINTRGVQIRGMVDKKVGFYSFIGENQIILPEYVRGFNRDYNPTTGRGRLYVPHEGFWKEFKDNGVDFFTARGYLSFQATKHINLQFGHDRFKIGNGYRSLILSDFAPAYLFLKMSTQVWKINYTNLYTKLTADINGGATGLRDGRYPDKYMSLHHLSINIGEKLNVGLFESVIYGADSLGQSADFEMQYLNPIIFYRALEQQNGSPDNALLGMDFKWLVTKKVSLYGQLVLDEFLLENIKKGDGWWANKFGVQLGGEYIDALGINNLDLQMEVNLARPYTYSHGTPYGNYSHYRQPLAHPLGANFNEMVAIARYQPIPRLNVEAKIIAAEYGTDSPDTNWGGNILLDNNTKEMNYGNKIAQGIKEQLLYGNLTASYQLRHNFFIDLSHTYRETNTDPNNTYTTNYTSAAIRWNIPQRLNEF